MLGSVVHIFVVFKADRELFAALRDRQRAVDHRDVVVRRHVGLASLDHYSRFRRDRARILASFNAARAELYVVRVAAHQANTFRSRRHFYRVDRDRAAGIDLGLALAGERHRTLRDRQRAGSVSNTIIGRNFGNSRLISRSQILLGALADIGDRGSRAESSFNCLGIAAQFTGNCVRTVQRLTVIDLAVGLGRDRQRQRVVDGDFVAVNADRDRLARVVAVDRQVLPLIGRDRRRGILGPDRLLRNHILRDLGRGTLQVMVDRDRGHIQLPDRVQRNNSAIRGRQILDSLLIGIRSSAAVGCGIPAGEPIVFTREGIGRQRLLHIIREALILHRARSILSVLIELHGVVDQLPHGKHGLIRNLFIRSYLRGFLRIARVRVELAFVVPDVRRIDALRPVGRIGFPSLRSLSRVADIDTCPALELIAFARRCRLNVYRLVDAQIIILFESILAVVLEPVNMRRGVFFLVFIDSLERDRIGRGNDLAAFHDDIRDNSIVLQDSEVLAGEKIVYRNVSVLVKELPVREDFAFGDACRNGRSDDCLTLVLVLQRVIVRL